MPCEEEGYNRHWVDVELLRVNYGLHRKLCLESYGEASLETASGICLLSSSFQVSVKTWLSLGLL